MSLVIRSGQRMSGDNPSGISRLNYSVELSDREGTQFFCEVKKVDDHYLIFSSYPSLGSLSTTSIMGVSHNIEEAEIKVYEVLFEYIKGFNQRSCSPNQTSLDVNSAKGLESLVNSSDKKVSDKALKIRDALGKS